MNVQGYGLEGPGIESQWGRDVPHPSRPALGPSQPLVQWEKVSYPGIKRQGRGVDHTPHLGPRLKKEQSCTSTPLWAFVACSSVNFTFTFTFDEFTGTQHEMT